MATKPLSQYLEELSELIANTPSTKDKVTILTKGITDESTKIVLKRVLGMAFDPRLEFTIPSGNLPYEVSKEVFQGRDPLNDFGNEEVLFFKILRGKLNYVIKNTPDTLKDPYKSQRWFIDLLKEMHVEDARLLVELKDKKWPYGGFTAELVAEAFPDVVTLPKKPEKQQASKKKTTRSRSRKGGEQKAIHGQNLST